MRFIRVAAQRLFAALIIAASSACQSTPMAALGPATNPAESRPHFNEALGALVIPTRRLDYRVGSEDVLEIVVFQVEELSRTVRVRPDGSISLPLLGGVRVGAQTTSEIERTLAKRLRESYLRDPQVSVFVKEHRAHAVSVLGEVNEPGIYYLRGGPQTLLQVLAEAGGLSEGGGASIELRRRTPKGRWEKTRINLAALLESGELGEDVLLQDDDVVFIPRTGRVFVSGAVSKPGAYDIEQPATVLKVLTLAGGLEFEARSGAIEVIRSNGSAHPEHLDFDVITRDPARDLRVFDGDVVLVRAHPIKLGLATVWRAVAGVVRLSTGI